ncbi:putative glucanbeta-glucosidase [Phaeomoniella chlamydospora]|uniref:glucan 1,3-beta-glucosidase n=1 Tax=Phaeomoniella chlamydospora TaxID=158046 RepID=A0A0G2E865_PHACM|nr:putative glucanbeta-glucosidase [Phaeomoniella chlamydospora]
MPLFTLLAAGVSLFIFVTGSFARVVGNLLPPEPWTGETLAIDASTKSPKAIPRAMPTEILRGVNIGNWLILEKWMDETNLFVDAFSDAVDQWTFDSIAGAEEALQKHWATWFTESDMEAIAAIGMNAIRIPIGYWAFNNTGTPFIKGADVFLERAIIWARTYGLKVLIDCHGSPGSQNGFTSSGHEGTVEWQAGNNIQRSLSVLKTMARKYGSTGYSDVVFGIELVNEPVSDYGNNFSITKEFARKGYSTVKATASNPELQIIMHDAFKNPPSYWLSLPSDVSSTNSRQFGIDSHFYQIFSSVYLSLNVQSHIAAACNWASVLAKTKQIMPIYIGEFSAVMNICIDTDHTSYPGTSCSSAGCQCSSTPIDKWNSSLVEVTRRFVEAQLDTFEYNASGWFMWAWRGPSAWGIKNLIETGVMPNPVTSRKYANQCTSSIYWTNTTIVDGR